MPLVMTSQRIILVCSECDAVWCDHRVVAAETAAGHQFDGRQVFCFEPWAVSRRALSQDLVFLRDTTPRWRIFYACEDV